MYRIAGNFRGAYISRIDIKFVFAVTNFAVAIIKTTPTFHLLSSRFLSTLCIHRVLSRPTLLGASRTLFTSLLAEAIDDDGMCLDKGHPGLGSTEPEHFFK